MSGLACNSARVERWSVSKLKTGCTSSSGSIAGANREEQKWVMLGTRLPARREDWGKKNTQRQVSSICLLQCIWFFIYFYTFKQYLYSKQSGYGGSDLRNNWKVCSHSSLTLNPGREISVEPPFEFGVLKDFTFRCSHLWAQMVPLPICWSQRLVCSREAEALALVQPVRHQATRQIQKTAVLSLRSIECNFRKDILCHPAHRHFTGSHIIQTFS